VCVIYLWLLRAWLGTGTEHASGKGTVNQSLNEKQDQAFSWPAIIHNSLKYETLILPPTDLFKSYPTNEVLRTSLRARLWRWSSRDAEKVSATGSLYSTSDRGGNTRHLQRLYCTVGWQLVI
jgi:hypothetical protein